MAANGFRIPPSGRIEVRRSRGNDEVVVTGEMDVSRSTEFRLPVAPLLAGDAGAVTIDLTGCTFMDFESGC